MSKAFRSRLLAWTTRRSIGRCRLKSAACVGQAYAQFLSPHDLSAAAKAVQAGQIKAEQMVDSIHTGHHPYYWVRTSFVSSLRCEGP